MGKGVAKTEKGKARPLPKCLWGSTAGEMRGRRRTGTSVRDDDVKERNRGLPRGHPEDTRIPQWLFLSKRLARWDFSFRRMILGIVEGGETRARLCGLRPVKRRRGTRWKSRGLEGVVMMGA